VEEVFRGGGGATHPREVFLRCLGTLSVWSKGTLLHLFLSTAGTGKAGGQSRKEEERRGTSYVLHFLPSLRKGRLLLGSHAGQSILEALHR
jgi:hypothetical protein